MRLLFIHSSQKLKQDEEDNLYIDGAYSNKVFERYLNISDDLTVMFRKENTKISKEFGISNLERFNDKKIKLLIYNNVNESIKSFLSIKKRRENKRLVKSAVKNSDKIIIRLPCDAGYDAIRYAKKYKKEYMVEVVGCIKDALKNYGIKGFFFSYYKYIKMKVAVKKAPYAIYVTNSFLQKKYPNCFKKIGCSDVELPVLEKEILDNRISKIKENKKLKNIKLASIGAIDVKYKGQEYVIKAINELKMKGYNIKYYIIGGGDNSYLKNIAIKENVLNNIIFTGAIPHKKIFEYLDNIDIYIQPSLVEGLCRAVIEAMSRACPVIVSNAGGNYELIDNKNYIFNKKNIYQLVNCIDKMTYEERIKEATNNFNNAIKYQYDILESKRNSFYEEFKNS